MVEAMAQMVGFYRNILGFERKNEEITTNFRRNRHEF